ncbi:Sapep family Mn(2+)-dependent dipeptidase [Anaerolentibacter hominis]|uniref:Sapep family Mn(2+)-dependent dipeptidase n=1 Tax=Anaerolentibacter hominis TaxID=3079009 RepID=UPI0031B8206D
MSQSMCSEEMKSWIADHQAEMVKDIIDVVNIRSVAEYGEGGYPFGTGCKKALDHLLKLAEGYGFETCNYEDYMGSATLKGTEGKKTIGIFAHADVVPEGTGWEYEPYNAVEKDGYLIGRGVSDNKGPAIMSLYALRFLKETGVKLKDNITLYFGCCEEKGMDDIKYWREHYPMPDFSLVPDVNFPVCYGEKGILELMAVSDVAGSELADFCGGEVSNTIPGEAYAVVRCEDQDKAIAILADCEGISAEKRDNCLVITGRGMSKHAAFPEDSVNANGVVARALLKADLVSGAAKNAVSFIARVCEDYYGASIDVPYEDKESGRMTHTCSVVRVENGKMLTKFNLRYPVTTDQEKMIEALKQFFAGWNFELEDIENNGPAYQPVDNPVVRALCDISNEVLGADLKPYTMGGGTYSRKLKNAIGFGPGIPDEKPIFPAGRGGGHQPDEFIRVGRLIDGLQIYIRALRTLDELI